MNSFHFRNIVALLSKQVKDTCKNLQVLVLFFIFPIIAFVMSNTLPTEAGGAMFFISLFATMHCVFAPLVAAASIIAEEKEKNTLRILILSNVTMPEYLIAIGCFIIFLTLLTGCSFLIMDPAIMAHGLSFMGILFMGCLVSASFGMCLGLQSRNASAANALAVPFGMIFSFVPMLASFDESIAKISRFTYGQQISFFITELKPDAPGLGVIAVNLILLLGIGVILYRRVKTEE